MGVPINFSNHIHISDKTWSNGALSYLGYADIDDSMLKELVANQKLQYIQISDYLPPAAYQIIDRILGMRPDLTFRLFHFLNAKTVDISFLKEMPHVKRLQIDCIDFRDNPERINLDVLTKLNLTALHIDCFDLRDYSFIQRLVPGLEDLAIMADTMGPGITFDCKWLLRFEGLKTLFLGKKAKKNLECISNLPDLKSLTLRGIRLSNFAFLNTMNLDRLALLWNSNSDLHELAALKQLKELELWRISKLSDISFIKELKALEVIKLQDLKHVQSLPDLADHASLQQLILIDTGINVKELPPYLQDKVSNWDYR
ncbi:hypothetical protein [Butyrivibrio proteoclasticus]|uniref:hypothetical protein n=1 Tax=Butyrivibrio proteoclasticus TaxID=43305 RepID=UPI00047EFA75|nr:hypothetical protein [Butyrivibrio proteoclasticus]